MGFATEWLAERAIFPAVINETPDYKTGIVVVVPAFNEPDITALFDSLSECSEPECKVEIIVVINARADSGEELIQNNKICIENIKRWKIKHQELFFRLFIFDTGQPMIKGWGVGLARKTGMDEALRRFDAINNPDGVIVCLDADCTVSKNYFTAIKTEMLDRRDHTACSIYFEHRLNDMFFPQEVTRNIILYELHLRYYLQGLRYSGFPYAFHTVGSALAVKAFQYIKAGGMNRKQAGEDFYFIQKLVPLGGYFYLNSATVYPSPRESFRVPFGTGATMTRMMREGNGLLLSYNINSFTELHWLFSSSGSLFSCRDKDLLDFFLSMPAGLKKFIPEQEWSEKINEIYANTSGPESFVKRFYGWFNMFRIVKYMNFVHQGIYDKQNVTTSANDLLSVNDHNFRSDDPEALLLFYRSMEKNEKP